MFSGIVEAQVQVQSTTAESGLIRISVARPKSFTDLKNGDSVSVNGVCLTIEKFDHNTLQFAIGHETLQVTGWTPGQLAKETLNLERSLCFGDRIHGHMVSGHVDAVGKILSRQDLGGSLVLQISAPMSLAGFLWKKGSCALNGVSLTINSLESGSNDGKHPKNEIRIGVCLIPETVLRTNLGKIEIGASVNIEVDMMARGLVTYLENSEVLKKLKTGSSL